MKEQIIDLLRRNVPYKKIAKQVDCSLSTVSYHARKHGLGCPDLGSGNRYDWVKVAAYYNAHTASETRMYFGFARSTWDKAIKRGDIVSRRYNDMKPSLNEVMVKNSSYKNGNLKRRLLEEGILQNVCSECGLGDEWNGNALVLHMDHINGDSKDNRK